MGEDIELLVQRFLDGELSRSERGTLLRRLGRDSGLRQRLIDDEEMLEAAAGLPRLAAPGDFVARTLARLPEQANEDVPATSPAPGHRARQFPWRAAVAAAASVLLVAAFWLGRASAPDRNQAAVITASAADGQEVLVRLVLIQPGARSVAIVGDFNGWDPMRSPLERAEAGVWSTTLELAPGRYNYLFLVDGEQWIVDPLAVETSVDGFGARNSVLDLGA